MRALITGAGGFVGRHLRAHLGEAGDEVVGLGPGEDLDVDVLDAGAVVESVAEAEPEVVYHLAARSHVGDSWSDPALVFRVNAEGTLNVLQACRAHGVDRVVVVGSADEYGAVEEAAVPLTEDAPLRPLTPYGASKVAADYLALQAFLGWGVPTVRVRAFNHTGPGQPDRFLVPALARRVVECERSRADEITVGNLDPVRDFTDVRDVVRAYRLLAEQGRPGQAYNVCSGTGTSVREVLERIISLSDRPLEYRVDDSLVRPVEVPRLVGDPSRIRADTGWAPEHSLDQTLADVLDAWRAAPG